MPPKSRPFLQEHGRRAWEEFRRARASRRSEVEAVKNNRFMSKRHQNQTIVIIIFALVWALLWSCSVLANGGDQRVVEGTYLINLSRAPFTPHTGDRVAFLASFVDIEKSKLVSEDLIVAVRIAKLGGRGTDKRAFLFEKENISVRGGILELSYTFTESGLHEIFFDFAFVSDPSNIYEAPDFLLDVQKPLKGYNTNQVLTAVLVGFVAGLMGGWFVKRIGSRA